MNHETLSRREAVALKWMCALAVPLRLILIFRYRFDSDEPQHMHVAWAWARGLLQYRDVFDNHMPLFHILSAPMFGAMGDNVRVLYLARLSVLPLYFATLVLLFAIAERLFDRRNALWATALTACFPPFFLGSLEYRTDDLWIVFWFTCLALLVSRVRPMRKMVLAGLALGLAFAVSLKSILFVVAIVTAVVATIRMTRSAFPLSRGTLVRRMAVFSGCALLVPSVVAAYFAWAGAWRQFAYCVLWHNGSAPNDHWWKVFWLVPGVPAIRFLAYRYAAAEGEPDVVRRRLFIFLTASTYLLCVGAIWPVKCRSAGGWGLRILPLANQRGCVRCAWRLLPSRSRFSRPP